MTAKDLILIADDDEDINAFVEANLRLEGYEIVKAADGEEALQIAYDRLPDLILLDVMVTKVNGYEVCQRLRSDTRTRNISIVMLTAGSLSADRVVGLTAGADDYLIKPFDPVELVARVEDRPSPVQGDAVDQPSDPVTGERPASGRSIEAHRRQGTVRCDVHRPRSLQTIQRPLRVPSWGRGDQAARSDGGGCDQFPRWLRSGSWGMSAATIS